MLLKKQLLSQQNLNAGFVSKLDVATQVMQGNLGFKNTIMGDNYSAGYMRIDPQGNTVIIYDGVSNQTFKVYSSSGSENVYIATVNAASSQSYGVIETEGATVNRLEINMINNKAVKFGTGAFSIGGVNQVNNSILSVHKTGDVWHATIGDFAAGVLKIGGNNLNGAVIQAWNQSTNAYRDLYLQRDGGNIGIATAAPEQKLHINAGQLLISTTVPTISNSSYGDGHIQMRTFDGNHPRIGFHRSGYSGVALYHNGNGNGQGSDYLRIRANDGNDSAIVLAGRKTAAYLNSASGGLGIPSGIYTNSGDGLLNNDGSIFAGGWFHVVHSKHDADGWSGQIAIPLAPNAGHDEMYWRHAAGTAWGPWRRIFSTNGVTNIGANGRFILPVGNNLYATTT